MSTLVKIDEHHDATSNGSPARRWKLQQATKKGYTDLRWVTEKDGTAVLKGKKP